MPCRGRRLIASRPLRCPDLLLQQCRAIRISKQLAIAHVVATAHLSLAQRCCGLRLVAKRLLLIPKRCLALRVPSQLTAAQAFAAPQFSRAQRFNRAAVLLRGGAGLFRMSGCRRCLPSQRLACRTPMANI